MREAVIVQAVRTPVGIGKPDRGDLHSWHPVDLSAHVLRGLVERAGVEPESIDDVIWGCVSQVGEQSANIGRNAVLAAGFPVTVPGTTVDRQCGSSQQAVHFAAAGVMSGQYEAVIAGGVESMSRVPMFSNMAGSDPFGPLMTERFPDLVNQGISAEMIAAQWNLSRAYLDDLAFDSQSRAAAARDAGEFDEQILVVPTPAGDVTTDQGIRATSREKLSELRPAFSPEGVVTAGNASQISDGSAALLITSADYARAHGLRPWARIHTTVMAGVDPVIMLTGPIPATAKALARSGLSLDQIGTFEVNEAFAAVIGAWLADSGASWEHTNSQGGAIALGHPLGASGARLMTTLIHRMRNRHIRYGLQTMCEGGGMANATVLELLD